MKDVRKYIHFILFKEIQTRNGEFVLKIRLMVSRAGMMQGDEMLLNRVKGKWYSLLLREFCSSYEN